MVGLGSNLSPNKILLVRIDKIGDLVATMAMDEMLSGSNITWALEKNVQFIAKNAIPPRKTYAVDAKNKWKSFWDFFNFLKNENFDQSLVFYAPWWICFCLFLARVPLRAGRRSQWFSFLFLNKTLRQSRSQSQKHEAEYNKDLVHFFMNHQTSQPAPILKLGAPDNRQLFEKWNLQSQNYFVVHPGMAGSALNWPQSSYNQLMAELVKKHTVVITGMASDDPWLSEIKPQWQHHPQVRWTQGQLSIDSLLYILKNAKAVIAPSTGVLHLAASLNTPVIGIYSPVKAHSSQRWGPRSHNSVHVLEPKSEFENCMATISVEQVLACLK